MSRPRRSRDEQNSRRCLDVWNRFFERGRLKPSSFRVVLFHRRGEGRVLRGRGILPRDILDLGSIPDRSRLFCRDVIFFRMVGQKLWGVDAWRKFKITVANQIRQPYHASPDFRPESLLKWRISLKVANVLSLQNTLYKRGCHI